MPFEESKLERFANKKISVVMMLLFHFFFSIPIATIVLESIFHYGRYIGSIARHISNTFPIS